MQFTDDHESNQRHEPSGGPMGPIPTQDAHTRDMTEDACWNALGSLGIGHLALRAEPVGVTIYPVNYLVTDRQLLFKSAPGTKLTELADHPFVALQVEKLVDGWWFSVMVKGKAERLAFDDDIESSGILELDAAQGGEKLNYVRIDPDVIAGRTFPDASHRHSAE